MHHEWTMADFDAALRHGLVYGEALRAAVARIRVLEQETQHLREQYAALEAQYTALLEKAAAVPPVPPSAPREA